MDTYEAQIWGLELAHHMKELLECMKGPVLQIESYRISMTQAKTGYLRGAPVRIQY